MHDQPPTLDAAIEARRLHAPACWRVDDAELVLAGANHAGLATRSILPVFVLPRRLAAEPLPLPELVVSLDLAGETSDVHAHAHHANRRMLQQLASLDAALCVAAGRRRYRLLAELLDEGTSLARFAALRFHFERPALVTDNRHGFARGTVLPIVTRRNHVQL